MILSVVIMQANRQNFWFCWLPSALIQSIAVQVTELNVHWPVEISTAAENRAISSSVSCSEHILLAKSNTALTKSSQPWREKEERTGKGRQKQRFSSDLFCSCLWWWAGDFFFFYILVSAFFLFFFHFQLAFSLIYTKLKCIGSNALPRALNICMPPYFPSKSTVLLRGLNALHIRTNTTSKQPGRTGDRHCLRLRVIYWLNGKKNKKLLHKGFFFLLHNIL